MNNRYHDIYLASIVRLFPSLVKLAQSSEQIKDVEEAVEQLIGMNLKTSTFGDSILHLAGSMDNAVGIENDKSIIFPNASVIQLLIR